MFRHRFGFSLIAALLLILAVASGAGAQQSGVIKGSVENLTAGGASVAGAEVVLTSYKGRVEAEKWTSTLDNDGNFLFENLGTEPSIAYQVSVVHQDATYYSPPLGFNVDVGEHEVEVVVFDSTTDGAVVASPARHLLLEPIPGGVSVTEIMILRNASDRTYIGGEEAHPGLRETLRFVLPEQAINLEISDGFLPTHTIPTAEGFVDTWPIFPGDDQRIYGYTIPSQAGAATFTTRLSVATDKVSVLMPDVGARMSVTNLPDRSAPDIQGSKYILFSGQNLAEGTEVTFTIEGLPAAAGPRTTTGGGDAGNMIAYVAGGGVIVLMAAALGIVTIRRRRRSYGEEYDEDDLADDEEDEVVESMADDDELESERQDLVASIASLDDAYEQGRIGADEYGMLRAQQKSRLLEIVAAQRLQAESRGN
jgi:hypothetical protein